MALVPTIGAPLLNAVAVKDGMQVVPFPDAFDATRYGVGGKAQTKGDSSENPVGNHFSFLLLVAVELKVALHDDTVQRIFGQNVPKGKGDFHDGAEKLIALINVSGAVQIVGMDQQKTQEEGTGRLGAFESGFAIKTGVGRINDKDTAVDVVHDIGENFSTAVMDMGHNDTFLPGIVALYCCLACPHADTAGHSATYKAGGRHLKETPKDSCPGRKNVDL